MTSIEHAARRLPAQARSRARFEQILDAAAALIAERGLGPVTMTDIAERADMAVTAVYRYFPNRQSVVRELALRTFESDAEIIVQAADDAGASPETFLADGIADYWQRHIDDPARLQLRAAIHADAELSALDLADSRRNAAVIAEGVVALTGRTDLDAVERQSLLLVELTDRLVQLATRVDSAEAKTLVAEFAEMFTRTLLRPQENEG